MKKKTATPHESQVSFGDNERVAHLFGPQGDHLRFLEDKLGLSIHSRGGQATIRGAKDQVQFAEKILKQIYSVLEKNAGVTREDFEQAIRILRDEGNSELRNMYMDSIHLPGRKQGIAPKTIGQKKYLEAITKYDIVFGVGPAGTGKTYLAMAMAVKALLSGQVERIVLTRPAIEAGEKLGFLPGDLEEKVNPYLRPLYDAMHDMVDYERAQNMIARGEIEVAPLAFMRGRTLNGAFIILDEAQNTTVEQMKMFLTRMGFYSKAVITGDITQVDLPRERKSGLTHALGVLKNVSGIFVHEFSGKDVVRHPLVAEIVEAYQKDEDERR